MKLSKEQISNLIWIVLIILIVFTPVGFHLRVFVNKIFAGDVDIVSMNEQKTFTDYNWQMVDLDGNTFNFESGKNQVVLINFWATWCPPCVAELPSLVELYKNYQNKVVFAFIANDDRAKVAAFLSKKNYELPVYFETSSTPESIESESIPATFILSKKGKIVVAEKGAADWNSDATKNLLDELLRE